MAVSLAGSTPDEPNREGQWFPQTHWSIVLAARDGTHAQDALQNLCSAYWHPLYAYVRRLSHSSHDAQDLTQAFFEHLLEKNALRNVSQDKGRFRSFLLSSFKHFL